MLRENKFTSAGELEIYCDEYDWGSVIHYHFPVDVQPWEVWLEIDWPEVRPGLPVLFVGRGPDWLCRELEQQYTPQASTVAHVDPRAAMAPPHVLRMIAAGVIRSRVAVAMEHGVVLGRSTPKE